MKLTRALVLASQSPRRREILHKLGLVFSVQPADVDESQHAGEEPAAYVQRLAETKARAVARSLAVNAAVLGADTTVVLDGLVLNKPQDLDESARMLARLRGREHVVHTGVALVLSEEGTVHTRVVSTRVRFRAFSDDTLQRYVHSREGMDKAGSYGIQELGAALVSEVFGSYSNVVGLPAAETLELLEAAQVLAEWP
jgi:septum formation protein